jgi:hypothetical protein
MFPVLLKQQVIVHWSDIELVYAHRKELAPLLLNLSWDRVQNTSDLIRCITQCR